MNRLKILVSCVFCLLMAVRVVAQDVLKEMDDKNSVKDTKIYTMLSLEGKKSVIHIMPNYYRRMLKISYLKDTITIDDYWGVTVEPKCLDKNFLQIKYEVRGGSNLALGNTLLLCISGDRMYEALHVLRYSDWESFDVKKYNVDFLLKDFKLTASVKEQVVSQDEPETNYHFYNKTTLQFDRKLKAFYSIKSSIDDTLNVSYPDLTYKREIEGNFPKVLLGREEYLLIGNQWFELGNNNTLIKY
jgi:hypothetical protein